MNFKPVGNNLKVHYIIMGVLIAFGTYPLSFVITPIVEFFDTTLFGDIVNGILGLVLAVIAIVSFVVGAIFVHKGLKTENKNYKSMLEDIHNEVGLIATKSGDNPIPPKYYIAQDEEKFALKIVLPNGVNPEKVTKAIPLYENAFRYKNIKVENNFDEITLIFIKKMPKVSTDHLYRAKEYPIFGFNPYNEPVVWNFDEVPHLGVYAPTGSGKSVFTKQMVKQLVDMGANMNFIDFKRVEFGPLKKYGYRVETDSLGAFEMVKDLEELMMQRYEEQENKGIVNYRDDNKNPVFLVFDELASMMDSFGADKEGKQRKSEFVASIGNIGRLGRSAGVFLIVVTQRPDTSILPGEIRANLNKSVVLKGGDSTIRRMAFGDGHSDLSPLKVGYAYINTDETIETVQIPFYDPNTFLNDVGKVS